MVSLLKFFARGRRDFAGEIAIANRAASSADLKSAASLAFEPITFFDCFVFAQSARLLRDVPEKAEAFLFLVFCAASPELLVFCSDDYFAGRARPRKASFFQTHHEAGEEFGALFRTLLTLFTLLTLHS